jgi:alpha-ketoglutarate-dependent 2,4-dichlorophenoxyacetate dioxygenase
MAITVMPVTENFAAEIGDTDLSQPLDAEDMAAMKAAFWKYAVLVFPDQDLTQEQHLAFAEAFGPLEKPGDNVISGWRDAPNRIPKVFADVSNLAPTGGLWDEKSRQRLFQLGNRLWHTDSSFKRLPALTSLLYGREIPPVGGQTEFADERAAWDALPETKKRQLEGLVAEHSIITSREKLGFTDFTDEERRDHAPQARPLVRTIPESGRKSLYLASHIGRIRGLDDGAAKALLDELTAHATQRQFVYQHRWRARDLIMWDNRCTMHRGLPFDDLRWKRDMRRATVSDTALAPIA